jgi:hypothetical protein
MERPELLRSACDRYVLPADQAGCTRFGHHALVGNPEVEAKWVRLRDAVLGDVGHHRDVVVRIPHWEPTAQGNLRGLASRWAEQE